jgi:outer membrane cobalamin receptor
MCGYADLEADLNDRFLLNLATRYEHYSDFGGNLAGKMAIRYKLFNKLSLRGSLSNGFRAPSIQQRYYSAITNGIRPEVCSHQRQEVFSTMNTRLRKYLGCLPWRQKNR